MVRKLYLTPASLPEGTQCRYLKIPSDPEWLGIFNNALLSLTNPWNFEQVNETDLTPDQVAATCYGIYVDWLDNSCDDVSEGQSPFWDNPDATDAEGTPEESEYTFSEQVEDWAIAAFIASSGVIGAAATYLTIAPRFRLLFKRSDVGGIVKLFIDDVLYGTVDTYSPTPDVIPFDVVIPE